VWDSVGDVIEVVEKGERFSKSLSGNNK
jgi:hypothetical protein